MARYIDADAMLETLKRKYPQWYTGKPKDSWMHYAWLVYYWAVREAPTIDAVPVVRCKDCKWWTKQEKSIQGRCALNGTYPTGGWYCANGRREGDE